MKKIIGYVCMAWIVSALVTAVSMAAEWQTLTLQESVANGGATHRAIITHADLTTATTNTAQAITITTSPAKSLFSVQSMKLVTAFQASSDTNHNSTALTVGDSGSANRLLTSTELNLYGTEIYQATGVLTVPYYYYSTATGVTATFTPNAQDAVSDLDAGEVWIYCTMIPY